MDMDMDIDYYKKIRERDNLSMFQATSPIYSNIWETILDNDENGNAVNKKPLIQEVAVTNRYLCLVYSPSYRPREMGRGREEGRKGGREEGREKGEKGGHLAPLSAVRVTAAYAIVMLK